MLFHGENWHDHSEFLHLRTLHLGTGHELRGWRLQSSVLPLQKGVCVWGGGGGKMVRNSDFSILKPPLPVINDCLWGS